MDILPLSTAFLTCSKFSPNSSSAGLERAISGKISCISLNKSLTLSVPMATPPNPDFMALKNCAALAPLCLNWGAYSPMESKKSSLASKPSRKPLVSIAKASSEVKPNSFINACAPWATCLKSCPNTSAILCTPAATSGNSSADSPTNCSRALLTASIAAPRFWVTPVAKSS